MKLLGQRTLLPNNPLPTCPNLYFHQQAYLNIQANTVSYFNFIDFIGFFLVAPSAALTSISLAKRTPLKSFVFHSCEISRLLCPFFY